MSASDHAAFQRAIAADPADLTCRLVYADLLEETGDPSHVARAAFVRAQVEADGLPPTDPHRAELLARAGRLFDTRWIEWWAPVCGAVGLPLPAPRPKAHAGYPGGHPYTGSLQTCSVHRFGTDSGGSPAHAAFEYAEFRRGWPEGLFLRGDLAAWREPLRQWAAVFPLRALGLRAGMLRDWLLIHGEHLGHVARLALNRCQTEVVQETLSSPDLPRLTELVIDFDTSRAGWGTEQIREVSESPAADRLESLTVGLTHPDEARVVARSRRFGRLKELVLDAGGLGNYGEDRTAGAVAALARADWVGQLAAFTLRLGRNARDADTYPLHPTVESAVLKLIAALDPDRLRFLDLDGLPAEHPRIGEAVAARFGTRVALG
jgi:uncharacterized protein (TIGR02996 family)